MKEEHGTTSERLLAATFAVLQRAGSEKLSMSAVANEAGVSRPTLYRYFESKQELLRAFGLYEQARYDAGLAAATSSLHGAARLDAVLRFIVEFQHSYSLRRMVDIEPEHVLTQMARVLPISRDRLRMYLPGDDGAIRASVVTRVAVSHYLLPDEDRERFLHELRLAAGLDPEG